jgi:cytochrome oxidase Cu insertion factor (SCO1/SenC/PrrC family)
MDDYPLISLKRLPLFAALLLVIFAGVSASSPPAAIPRLRPTPPKIGQRPPAFTLRDHQGRRVSFGDSVGTKVVLVFYRGYW